MPSAEDRPEYGWRPPDRDPVRALVWWCIAAALLLFWSYVCTGGWFTW